MIRVNKKMAKCMGQQYQSDRLHTSYCPTIFYLLEVIQQIMVKITDSSQATTTKKDK